MADVIRQYRKSGSFKGDARVRWRLDDDPAKAVEKAADLLMRGLAYSIGPTAQWLPEYDQVAEWLADNHGKGLMCIGDCGRGKTVITREYPCAWQCGNEAYYPVNDKKNTALYERYRRLAKDDPRVLFGGRLAEYKYCDMDQVIASALERAEEILK